MTIAIIRDDLSPDWSRICVENFPNNSSFRDMQRMTVIGEVLPGAGDATERQD
jgi:hypothetical protein